uniref:G-protein coupled receptors family 1 profile domain-containing protein n=1 Tax=Parascaris univalens TaxID=6257 RepID=A0A915C520_PARUN
MDNITFGGDLISNNVLLIADVVFFRNNRSVYPENPREELELNGDQMFCEDIWMRALINVPYLSLYVLSIVLNSLLLLMSVNKPHKHRWKRLSLLMANLAFCNIILTIGFTAYTLLIDVFYYVQNIESIFIVGWPFADFCYAALTETLKYQIVHNVVFVQALFILLIAVDRYFSLFPNYDPFIESSWTPSLITILPYILVAVLLDFRLQNIIFGTSVALFICIFALIIPSMLAFVFTICTVMRQRQMNIISSYRCNQRSYPIAILIILTVQLFEKFAFFVELMSRNFDIEMAIGETTSDASYFMGALQIYFQISHELVVYSPLYIVSVLLLVMRNYRVRIIERCRRLMRFVLCRGRKDKIDYSCETMRSIIADQTRAKRMRSYTHPANV